MSPGRQAEQDRTQCTPCRGTGRLISAKGGTRHEVSCPWCGGTGRFQPGRDAQAEAAGDSGEPGATAEPGKPGATGQPDATAEPDATGRP